MKLRVARHTASLEAMTGFYTQVPGMEILGGFKQHDGYDGIFLGRKNADWHLEFTVSDEAPDHLPGADDLLVFYVKSGEELHEIKERFKQKGIPEYVPGNPYWQQHGVLYKDPDGYGVMIAVEPGKN